MTTNTTHLLGITLALLISISAPAWSATLPYEEEDSVAAGATPSYAEPTTVNDTDVASIEQHVDFKKRVTTWTSDISTYSKTYQDLKEEKQDIISTTDVYNKGNQRELDFEKNHESMLASLSKANRLLDEFQKLNDGLASTVTAIQTVEAEQQGQITLDALKDYTRTKTAGENLQTLVRTDLNELRDYKTRVNNALIEEVHRYNLKIGFRSRIAYMWIGAFVLVFAALAFLLLRKTLIIPPGSTMQFTAVILIIFVIILFGVTDVMGENGVTGILAAIAGYILGKSGTGEAPQDLEAIIRAAQGQPQPANGNPNPNPDNQE